MPLYNAHLVPRQEKNNLLLCTGCKGLADHKNIKSLISVFNIAKMKTYQNKE